MRHEDLVLDIMRHDVLCIQIASFLDASVCMLL
jgi:hypothetical protein